MEEQEFIKKYLEEEIIFKSWGEYVKCSILKSMAKECISNDTLKIEVKVRTKSIDSLLAKAFHRNKNYENPYTDITDKVGIRFIVLYLDEVQLIGELVEKYSEDWSYSKDKDFKEEILENPDKFGYESLHYVVKSNKELVCNNIIVPIGTPCEIQIRTLLQHAYCEMSHNTTYKKNVHNKVRRVTARSMALIESADYFFKEVKELVSKEELNYSDLLPKLIEYYSSFHELEFEKSINDLIIDAFQSLLYKDIFLDVQNFIQSKPFIKQRIGKFYDIKLIYRQPVILLVYYLISKKRTKVMELWPLTDDELIPLFNDLGMRLEE